MSHILPRPCSCRLLIFTRFPEAGKTKTRLISALGAEGAARLQKRLAERMINEARLLEQRLGTGTTVHYRGGSLAEMTDWLGHLSFLEQAAGDLGRKMQTAFCQAFAAGAGRAVLVGTDIPDLNVNILAQAFQALESQDVVLGPSRDGGYYLIGLSAPAAPRLLTPLFQGMVWSTGDVFAVTSGRLAKTGLSVALLPTLSDIDRPEDLTLAEAKGLL